MSAAMEAAIEGITAVGFSFLNYAHDADLTGPKKYVKEIAHGVLKNGLPTNTLLNVNFPDVHHGVHVSDQYKGMDDSELPLSGGFHKVSTPWIIKTSPGISLLITHPYWSRNKTFTSVSAVVHSDESPLVLKWFFELNQELPDTPDVVNMEQQIIKRGTPLILLIPFKREKINHKIEYLKPENIQKLYRNTTSSTVSWISDTWYNKARKQIGNLYK